jgi:putative FmdB family regulatory protein
MPIYEYRCPRCDLQFEEWQRGYEEKTLTCPQCGADSPRVVSGSAFILKGSGWYATDYADRKPEVANKYSGKNKKPSCKPVDVPSLATNPSAPPAPKKKAASGKAGRKP